MQELDILAIAAHPDDIELGCGGTLIKQVSLGYSIGIIDLTMGEMGTRGTEEIRAAEAAEAGKIMGATIRENLHIRDGWISTSEENKMKVISKIRQYRPRIVLTNAPTDRHPDHGNAAQLVKEATWLAGLGKILTMDEGGEPQMPWRTERVYHFIQYQPLVPDFIVDIQGFVEQKREAVMAYKSQFYKEDSSEPETLISSAGFLAMTEARNYTMGNYGRIPVGEGFISAFKPTVDELFHLIQ